MEKPKGVYATCRKVYSGYVGVIRTPHWSQSVGPVRTNRDDAKQDAARELDNILRAAI